MAKFNPMELVYMFFRTTERGHLLEPLSGFGGFASGLAAASKGLWQSAATADSCNERHLAALIDEPEQQVRGFMFWLYNKVDKDIAPYIYGIAVLSGSIRGTLAALDAAVFADNVTEDEHFFTNMYTTYTEGLLRRTKG